MNVEDCGSDIVVSMTRDEYALVISLIGEALETGDPRDFETRVGASTEGVSELLRTLPRLPPSARSS